MMGIKLIEPPDEMPVSLDEARTAARLNGTDNDSELTTQVLALTAEAEHECGQVIISRTFLTTLAQFPDAIDAPALPLVEVLSVKYLDVDGVEQTVPASLYEIDDSVSPPRVVPSVGAAWPATVERRDAVRMTSVCGYGATSATTPAGFKGYILGRVKEIFAPAGAPESPHLIRMLDSLKEY